jgi:hypothetical protein
VKEYKGVSSEVLDFKYRLESVSSDRETARVAYIGTGGDHHNMVDLGIDQ